jgi:hypothetical protein
MIRTSEDVEDYLLDAATTLMARTGSKNGLILIGRVKDPDHLAPFLSLFPCTSLYILAPLIISLQQYLLLNMTILTSSVVSKSGTTV